MSGVPISSFAPWLTPEEQPAPSNKAPLEQTLFGELVDPVYGIRVNTQTLQVSWPGFEAANLGDAQQFLERLKIAVTTAERVVLERCKDHPASRQRESGV